MLTNKFKIKFGIKPKTKSKMVYVGMSGGVDSSVSAFLLKRQGFDVTGVFIKVWNPDSSDCGWKDERRDAMRVCAVLDIPFITLDFSKQYKKEVVDYMIEEYKQGRTPNPDVMCNRHVKFGSFLSYALDKQIDFIATGHYAQCIYDKDQYQFALKEGLDKNKDQSYFLWTLKQSDLKHTLFPIGHLQKDQVREIARKNNIPVFDKKDSQGVCFIGHLDMKNFLKEYIKCNPGYVLDTEGHIIGRHDGAILYTEGERHGFRIDLPVTDREPYYIVRKDIENNTLIAVPESVYKDRQTLNISDISNTSNKTVNISNLSFTKENIEMTEIVCDARIRYRQEKQKCTLKNINHKKNTAIVEFQDSQISIAYGQSAVFYVDDICIGGGIISI
jgi:tRNA-uridine 2-sulfurtransferase